MKAKWLINPFERIAGWQALLIGICILSLTAILGSINSIIFDGVIDAHVFDHYFPLAFLAQAVDWVSLFLIMWLAGVCFSKSKIRAIDVAGTMALSRTPMLLLVILGFLPIAPQNISDISRIVIFSLVSIVLGIWMVALMYHAFSTSCHIKGARGIITFIGALLVAEIVSKCIFIFLLGNLFMGVNIANDNNASVTNPTENTAVVDLSDIHQSAERIVAAFKQNDFDAVVAYFDDKMKEGLSANKLKLTWLQITMMQGAFESADLQNAKESHGEEYDVIDIPCAFKRSQMNLRLTFNKDGTIGGLFILPAK